jgi:hypothetical protein
MIPHFVSVVGIGSKKWKLTIMIATTSSCISSACCCSFDVDVELCYEFIY